MTGEAKLELRGHENVVEVVAWAPIAAYGAIRELAGIPVCLDCVINMDQLIDCSLEYGPLQATRSFFGQWGAR